MTERIKSLIERAEYQSQKHSGSDWQVHVEPSREQIFEKFAELIVRECIDVVGKATASPNAYQALMKHFGVEE